MQSAGGGGRLGFTPVGFPSRAIRDQERCIENDDERRLFRGSLAKFLHLLDVRIKSRALRTGFVTLGRANFKLCCQVEKLFGAQPWDIRGAELFWFVFFESFNTFRCRYFAHGNPSFQNSAVFGFSVGQLSLVLTRVGIYEISRKNRRNGAVR
jgi:hypothetical protein